jgi:hypothetical protein
MLHHALPISDAVPGPSSLKTTLSRSAGVQCPAMLVDEADQQPPGLLHEPFSSPVDLLITASSGHVNNRQVRWPFCGLSQC